MEGAMSAPDEKISALAQRMRANGASVVRDHEGNTILHMPLGTSTASPIEGLGNKSAEQLKAFVERVECLEEERKAISDDIKEVYSEAKLNGFDPKIIRKIVQIRKDPEEYLEQSELLDTYMHALGLAS
jgi:uncharacterized protein (UPF0335 family)